jgi:hypothetical protein
MTGAGTRARRSRVALVTRLFVVAALTYLAGVGISFLLDRTDPWISGLSTLGPMLGGAAGGFLVRRSRRDGPG